MFVNDTIELMNKLTEEQISDFIKTVKDPAGEYDPSVKFLEDKDWLDKFYKQHVLLYKVLGQQTIVKIDPECTYAAESSGNTATKQVANRIIKIVPGYLNKYQFNTNVFANKYIPKANGIGVTKHLMGYAKRIRLGPHKFYELCQEIAELGKIHEDLKDGNRLGEVMISIDPRSFVYIGFDGCLTSSCWRYNSFGYYFSLFANTFCWYLLDPKETYETDDFKSGKKFMARGLGSFDPTNNLLKLHNTMGTSNGQSSVTSAFTATLWSSLYKKLLLPDCNRIFLEDKTKYQSSVPGVYMYFDSPNITIRNKPIKNLNKEMDYAFA